MRVIYVVLLSLLIIACGSPKKYYSNGNYNKAYSAALKDLKSGKKERALKSILNNSLNEMIEENKSERVALLRSDIIEDWEQAYIDTEALIDLYYEGNRYIDPQYSSIMKTVETENDVLRDNIIDSYVELGDVSMGVYSERGDKRQAQEAYVMYNSALRYNQSTGTGDIRIKADEALLAGTVSIDITLDTWDAKYKWDIERAFRQLEDNDELFYDIRFDNWSQKTDCQLEIEFSSLDKDIRQQSRTENYIEEIEDGYRNEVDTSGNTTRVPIYREVSGQVNIIDETITFNWDIRVMADNGIGYCDWSDNRFSVSRRIVITNYETYGDERAIPRDYRNNLTNQTFTTSDERNLIEELIEESYDTIERYYF
jgi:hypothetical protein